MKSNIAISPDFFDAFIRLPKNAQGNVRNFFDKFNDNPNSS